MLSHTAINLLAFPSHWEIIVILVAVLLLFGGRKLPELARGLGRGLRQFKEEYKGVKGDLDAEPDEERDPHPSARKKIRSGDPHANAADEGDSSDEHSKQPAGSRREED